MHKLLRVKYIALFCLLVLILSGCTNTIQEDIIPKNTVGNSSQNLLNNGYVAKQGDWLYYCINNDESVLYKIKTSGRDETVLLKMQNSDISNINVVDDWIYFINDNQLYKIDIEGEHMTPVIDECSKCIIANDNIYYTVNNSNEYNLNLHSVNMNGENKELLCENAYDYSIQNSTLYYIRQTEDKKSKLYQMGLNDLKEEIVFSDVRQYTIYKNSIFCLLGESEEIIWIDLENKTSTTLSTRTGLECLEGYEFYSISADSNNLYIVCTVLKGVIVIDLNSDNYENTLYYDNWQLFVTLYVFDEDVYGIDYDGRLYELFHNGNWKKKLN